MVQGNQNEGALEINIRNPAPELRSRIARPRLTESEGQVRVADQARGSIRVDAELLGEDADVDGGPEKCRVSEERIDGTDNEDHGLLPVGPLKLAGWLRCMIMAGRGASYLERIIGIERRDGEERLSIPGVIALYDQASA